VRQGGIGDAAFNRPVAGAFEQQVRNRDAAADAIVNFGLGPAIERAMAGKSDHRKTQNTRQGKQSAPYTAKNLTQNCLPKPLAGSINSKHEFIDRKWLTIAEIVFGKGVVF